MLTAGNEKGRRIVLDTLESGDAVRAKKKCKHDGMTKIELNTAMEICLTCGAKKKWLVSDARWRRPR